MRESVLMLDVEDLVTVLVGRLTAGDRSTLAVAALKSLDHDYASMVIEAVLLDGAGMPIAPLFSYMDEAAFWADIADPEEVEAYCFACFKAMMPSRQLAFLKYVQRGKLA